MEVIKMFMIKGSFPDLNDYINAERSSKFAAASIKKEWTDIVWAEAKSQKLPKFNGPVKIDYQWYCKDKKKDKSNIAFAKKFIEDGLVKAKVIKNDGWNDIEGFSDEFYIDKGFARVVVWITGNVDLPAHWKGGGDSAHPLGVRVSRPALTGGGDVND